MKNEFRCACPVTSAIDIVGDKWTLVIIKHMLLEGVRTFKDLVETDESIATNILSSRLKRLEEYGIVRKEKLPHNKKTNIYTLTQRGLELTPIIVELILWSEDNVREFHPNLYSDDRIELLKKDKKGAIDLLVEGYKSRFWDQEIL